MRKIKFSYVSYVKILRKSLREKIRTCECSLNKVDFMEKVFAALPHFPRKRFQLRHSKIWKKTEKYPFQTLRAFVFKLKLASRPFSKKLPMAEFWFK